MTSAVANPYEAMLSTILQQLKLPSQVYELDESKKDWFYCHVYFSYEHRISKKLINETCTARSETDIDAKEKVSQLAVEILKKKCGFKVEDSSSVDIRRINECANRFTARYRGLKTITKLLSKEMKILRGI
ncbi:uncharacterized protein LOC126659673 [Mercurialis annua]|uniref:uncharacterized protein LOC126659673 n=1 Tax=Mercurialis annua TaxID=3986 RepID=UPI00215F7C2F|nr:uncharacterized protein LOC126659673 [Mercurialis annua]